MVEARVRREEAVSGIHVNIRVKHVEECSVAVSEELLQKILFGYFEVKTGNSSKMHIEQAGTSAFPLRVSWDNLLEHDARQDLLK